MQKSLACYKQNNSQFSSSREYLMYMFGDLDGYMFKCCKQLSNGEEVFVSEYFKSNQLFSQAFAGKKDTYVSMNSFHFSKNANKVERKESNVKRLNALYVDIDCYKKGLRNDLVLKDLEDRVFGTELPYPTFVLDSGRGLYLIWKFNKSEDKNALPRWKVVQDYLINALAQYGSDSACRDASRILRVPNTINSKSGTPVSILRYYGEEYSLYGMMKTLEIDYSFVKQPKTNRGATQKQINYATILASKAGVALPDFSSRSETYKFIEKYQSVAPYKANKKVAYFDKESPKALLKGYLSDLRTLFSVRKRPDCKREIALFLCRYWNYELYHDHALALKETLSLNESFAYPFKEQYVIQNTKSAVKRIDAGEKYAYKKSTIIEILDITKEEMANLRYLVVLTDSEKKELKKQRNHNSYVMRLLKSGKTTKASKIADRFSALNDCLAEGLSASEIMHKLEISQATYYRMINQLNEKKGKEEPEYIQQELKLIVPDRTETKESENKECSSPRVMTACQFIVEVLKKWFCGVFSFFKSPFWKGALAPQGNWGNIYNLIIKERNIDYGLSIYPGGYERSDDCRGHDSA